jgi:uncharacterized membrane protein YqjE
MPPNEPPPRGVLESLRRLCDAGLGLLQNRVELIAVEIQEEKARLVKVLILAGAMVLLGNMAAVLGTATIVVLVDKSAQVPVLAGLSLLYLLLALGAFLALRRLLRSAPPPLKDTVSELKQDRDWLNSQK